MTSTFTGRSFVVTGGGSGIGLAIATRLVIDGASVVLVGRKPDTLRTASDAITAATPTATVLTRSLDVRDDVAVEQAMASAAAELGGLHGLVNNAAGNFVVPAETMSARAFSAVVDIVLKGTFNCSTSLARIMKEQGNGAAILNVIATYAWTGHPGTVHSAAAKAGVLAMTRTLAVEWASYGIRVNAIAPGPTETKGAAAALWPTAEDRERLLQSVPLGRFASPDEIAGCAAFLLSDVAAYVTGEVLTVDGGQWLGKSIYGTDDPRSGTGRPN